MDLLFKGGLLLPCDDRNPSIRADLRVRNGIIVEIGTDLDPLDCVCVDASRNWILPGFVQTHIHLCQTLFRGMAEDRALMEWLGERIWPLEAAHDSESAGLSARLGIVEMLLGGTTSFMDMGSLRHTDEIFEACEEFGVRASVGRALMDRENPAGLHASSEENLRGACQEADRWHNKGRLRYAFSPRFVPSCSDGLLRECVAEARGRKAMLHTHASENLDELNLVRELTGMENIEYLGEVGLLGPDVGLAHCIHLNDQEVDLLAQTGTRLLHCPSSNMKLASGIASVPALLAKGVHVSLGADGAPCNNRLDAFSEMRHAGLLQSLKVGAGALPAQAILRMATLSGAEALGLAGQVGSLSVGKKADLILLNADAPALLSAANPVDLVVYSAGPEHVESVYIEGERMVHKGDVRGWDGAEAAARVRRTSQAVADRAFG
jgi:5-methylthioadenosine/S-adenosylhomocysteine deaminase